MAIKGESILKYWWVWIASISFISYFPVIDNFFGWDDFLWLYRAKALSENPVSMFRSEGLYFDPIVYLSFWFNFKLFGLDYRWYHITDITIHAINGLLVFYFVKLYLRDDLSALLSSLIFVSAFAASDAVLWSSSRVDLLGTMFSLITIILFFKYLKNDNKNLYMGSLLTYILALGAKVTPAIIPVLLLRLFITEREDSQKGYSIFIPFVVITLGYFILLKVTMSGGSFESFFHLNIYNYSLAFASLFIPETVLSKWNISYAFLLTYTLILLFWLIRFTAQINRLKSIGLFMMLLFLTPVIILEFKLPSENNIYYLLGSPSHRIYLATIGMSVFIGSVLTGLVKKRKRFAVIIILFLLVINIYEVRHREMLWESGTVEIKDSVSKLMKLKPSIPEHSTILFVNFPLSTAFFEPFIKVYYDLKDVKVSSVLYRKLWKEGDEILFLKEYVDSNRKVLAFIMDHRKNIYDIKLKEQPGDGRPGSSW